MPEAEQKKLYDAIQADPLGSWALFAPAGWSKTTVCTTLFVYAVNDRYSDPQQFENIEIDLLQKRKLMGKNNGIWRISVPAWIRQCQEYAIDRVKEKEPDVTAEKIVDATRRGLKPRLFLEEVDKFKQTDFTKQEIFRLFNTIYEHMGQLVVNSNLTWTEFNEQFDATIARRVKEMCTVKHYFPKGGE